MSYPVERFHAWWRLASFHVMDDHPENGRVQSDFLLLGDWQGQPWRCFRS
jgi:hypothetical protein